MVAASQDAQGAGAHARGAAVRREDPQRRRATWRRRTRSTATRSWSSATTVKTRRHHRRHHRQGPVRRLNTNVLRGARPQMQASWQAEGVEIDVVRDRQQGPRLPAAASAPTSSRTSTQLGDRPQLEKLIGPVKVHARRAIADGKLDARATSCYTRFINTMKQEPVIEQLLPLSRRAARRAARTTGTTSTSPTRRAVLDERADALHRGAGLPGGGREHGLRAVGAHGRDEGRHRQRRQR